MANTKAAKPSQPKDKTSPKLMSMEELLSSTGYKPSSSSKNSGLRSSSSVSLKTAGLKIPAQKKSSPMSMEELLKSTGYKIPVLKRGQEVKGKVVSVSKSEIILDIGAKSEGIIYGREVAANPDLLMTLSPGDSLEATVIYPENEQGQVVLSLRKHSGIRRWTELEDKKDTGEVIDVIVSEINRGGLICEYFGIRGFLPASQLLQVSSRDLIGKRLSVSIIEAEQSTNRLIFSQKTQETKDLTAIKKILTKIKIGEKYAGKITAVLPFGIFVEIQADKDAAKSTHSKPGEPGPDAGLGKIEGLVHISEITWEKVDDPAKGFTVGQSLEVMVVSKDDEAGRLNLSVKQLSVDPFAQVAGKYSKDQKVSGKVTKVTPYGVFISLEDGLEGLMHISKIPPNMSLSVGDKVDCEVESVDVATRRVALVPIETAKPILYR